MPYPNEHTNRPEEGERERRYVPPGQSELRLVDGANGEPKTLVGYAAVFDKLSVEMWGFREKIRPGAFAKSLERKDDIRALVEHTGGLTTLGRTTAGTLKLKEDDIGLHSEIVVPDTQAGRDMVTLIERGDISQMSFAFRVRKQEWSEPEEGPDIRTLIEVDLYDVSPVSFPAYDATTIAVRDHEQWRNEKAAARAAGDADRKRRLEAFDKAPLVR